MKTFLLGIFLAVAVIAKPSIHAQPSILTQPTQAPPLCTMETYAQVSTNWPPYMYYQTFIDENYYYELINSELLRVLDPKSLKLLRSIAIQELEGDRYLDAAQLFGGRFFFYIPDDKAIVPLNMEKGKVIDEEAIKVPGNMLSFRVFQNHIVYWNFNSIYSLSRREQSEPKIIYHSEGDFNINLLTETEAVISPTGYQANRPWRYINLSTGYVSDPVIFGVNLTAYSKYDDWVYLGETHNLARWNIKTGDIELHKVKEQLTAAATDGELLYQLTKSGFVQISRVKTPTQILCAAAIPATNFHISEFTAGGVFHGYSNSMKTLTVFRASLPE